MRLNHLVKYQCYVICWVDWDSFISIDVSLRQLRTQFYGRINLLVYMHVSMYWRRYLFWASVLSCNIFWRRVNDDISSFYIYTHVYAHLLHLSKAFKLKIAIIKTNTRNLTFFPYNGSYDQLRCNFFEFHAPIFILLKHIFK